MEDALRFLEGGKSMGVEIARHRWEETPLGPIRDWPAALKIAVSMMINSDFPKCLCWGEELTAIYNDAFITILGNKHPCLGQPFAEIWHEAWHEIGPIVDRALRGQATFIEDFPLEIHRSDQPELAHFTFCYSPVRDETGVVRGMLDTVVETTGKIRAEKLAQLRNRELVHRSRNAFALVSGLVRHTHRNSVDLRDAQEKLQSRLAALVAAQDILTHSAGGDADLAAVVASVLEPFGVENGRIAFSGPPVRIGREQVTSLSLGLHELATNAAKYGALGTPEGRVAIEWALSAEDDGSVFTLTWVEAGGPPVTPPTRRGFGSSLIEIVLAQSLDGKVERTFAPDGMRLLLTSRAHGLVFEPAYG